MNILIQPHTVKETPADLAKQATIVDAQPSQRLSASLHLHIHVRHSLLTKIATNSLQLHTVREVFVSPVKSATIVVAPTQILFAHKVQAAIVVNQTQELLLVLTTCPQLVVHLM